MNVVALITAFVVAVILIYSPLQAIQLLWVNLIMDSLAALALATDEPKPEVLQRPPYRRDEYIISGKNGQAHPGCSHLLGHCDFHYFIGRRVMVP